MSLEIKGKIVKVLDTETGTSKAGKEWQKKLFVVETEETYNNIYCFELFNAEKIEAFNSKFKVNDNINVSFNVNTNEWNGKYYTSLSAWKMDIIGEVKHEEIPAVSEELPTDDLPF